MLKRGLVAGLVLLFVSFGLNWLMGFVFPSYGASYQNPAIFRPWSDPLMLVYFAHPFIAGMVLSYLWDKVKAKDPMEFARLYFIVATIPGMFITYTSMQVTLLMVLVWSLLGFLEAYVAGYIFTKVK